MVRPFDYKFFENILEKTGVITQGELPLTMMVGDEKKEIGTARITLDGNIIVGSELSISDEAMSSLGFEIQYVNISCAFQNESFARIRRVEDEIVEVPYEKSRNVYADLRLDEFNNSIEERVDGE